MKIVICDDEKEIRKTIERNVRLLYPDAEIFQFENGHSLLKSEKRFDILFLDIQMEGINGMETARALRKAGSNVTIIFVTAIEEYVFQAFDVGAFHYLLKPIEPVKFYEILKRAVEDRKEVRARAEKSEAGITIKRGTITEKVYLCEIIYMEVYNRKVIVHKTDEEMEFYGKLCDLEKNLESDFVRCHRAFLINMKYVLKYNSNSVTLENNITIPMSKQKYSEFVKRYVKYISNEVKKSAH